MCLFTLVTRAICSWGAPYVGCVVPSVVAGLTPVGGLVGVAGLWLVSRPHLVQKLLATGWQGQVMKLLAAGPQRTCG